MAIRRAWVFTALLLGLVSSPARAAPSRAQLPDLGHVRYRDPHRARAMWFGVEVGGIVLPARLGLFDRTVWTVRATPSWALALTPWLALGGRHGMTWYEAQASTDVRLRIHEHQVELSGRPLAAASTTTMHDRLALGVETHVVRSILVGEQDFAVGGLVDTVLTLGYGIEHLLGQRWAVDWAAQFRHAWVFRSTQRQIRGSVRGVFWPRPDHELRLDVIAYYVNRDEDQAGNPLPRHGGYAQVGLEYQWISRYQIGPMVRGRFASSFLSGEAPVYEIRDEALNNLYGDVTVGVRAIW